MSAKDHTGERCPNCRGYYKSLGNHWQQNSDCDYPTLEPEHEEFTIGMLLSGKGMLSNHTLDHNPPSTSRLRVRHTDKEFLEWVSELFGPLSLKIRTVRSAEKNQESMESAFEWAKNYEFGATYKFVTRQLPRFREMAIEWCNLEYGTSTYTPATDPPDLTYLSPLTLKLLFHLKGRYNEPRDEIWIPVTKTPMDFDYWPDVIGGKLKTRKYLHNSETEYWIIEDGLGAVRYMDSDPYTEANPMPRFREKIPDLGVLTDTKRVREIEKELGWVE